MQFPSFFCDFPRREAKRCFMGSSSVAHYIVALKNLSHVGGRTPVPFFCVRWVCIFSYLPIVRNRGCKCQCALLYLPCETKSEHETRERKYGRTCCDLLRRILYICDLDRAFLAPAVMNSRSMYGPAIIG